MTDKERLWMVTQTAKNRLRRIRELEKEVKRLKKIMIQDSVALVRERHPHQGLL